MSANTTTTQRSTVVSVFHDRAEGERAVADLKRAGFGDNEISVVTKGREEDRYGVSDPVATGAATGAAVGAGAAALVSLGMSFGVIPVIGPILAVGPIAAALLSAAGGAAAGGLVGALVGMGLSESEARFYEEEVGSGRTLVIVKAGNRYDEAWSILQRHGAYNQDNMPAGRAATGATAGNMAGSTSDVGSRSASAMPAGRGTTSYTATTGRTNPESAGGCPPSPTPASPSARDKGARTRT